MIQQQEARKLAVKQQQTPAQQLLSTFPAAANGETSVYFNFWTASEHLQTNYMNEETQATTTESSYR